MKKLLILLFCLLPTLAFAQSQRNPCYNTNLVNGNQNCVPVGTSTPLPVTGTFTPSGTQTVSGTVTANQGSANITPWNVQLSGYNYKNISVDGNIVLKATPGQFGGIVVNTAGVGSTITLYDDLACISNVIGTFSTTSQIALNTNIITTTALCVITAGSTPANVTVLWR